MSCKISHHRANLTRTFKTEYPLPIGGTIRQEILREISCFFFARMLGDSTLISLCKNANSIKTTPQLHLNSTFVVYHKGVPGRRDTTGAGNSPGEKLMLGGTQVNPLVLQKGNEVAQT